MNCVKRSSDQNMGRIDRNRLAKDKHLVSK